MDLCGLVRGDDFMATVNRLIRYVPDGTAWKLEVEADARHAEILLKAFGFNDKKKGVDMPEEKQVAKDMVIVDQLAELSVEQMGEYRSLVMRMAYLSQDRPDLGHVVRSLASKMRSPSENDWLKLKRAVKNGEHTLMVKGTTEGGGPVVLGGGVLWDVQDGHAGRVHAGRGGVLDGGDQAFDLEGRQQRGKGDV